jgi:hypothetical protein
MQSKFIVKIYWKKLEPDNLTLMLVSEASQSTPMTRGVGPSPIQHIVRALEIQKVKKY